MLITQDHHVFHDTVRYNLRIARPAATDEEMYAASGRRRCRWLADLPHGLDTEVGRDHHSSTAPPPSSFPWPASPSRIRTP